MVPLTRLDMPDSVTSIMPYAFYGCKNLETVVLSTNLKEIPAYSFSYCNGLTSIALPYSVNSIDVKAFQYCINLENVDIPILPLIMDEQTGKAGNITRIEAFIDLVMRKKRRRDS